MPKRKPIRWKLMLSLSLAIAAVVGSGLIYERLQHENHVAQLAAQVIRGEPGEATAAIDELAALSNPPLDILVSAAASPTRPTALAAQNAITELLQVSQRQLRIGLDATKANRQLQRLAEALDNHRQSFAADDFTWLARTAETIIRQAGTVGSANSSDIAYHCDIVLAMIETRARGANRTAAKNSKSINSLPTTTTNAKITSPGIGAAIQPEAEAPLASDDPESLFTAPPVSAWRTVVPRDEARKVVDPPKKATGSAQDISTNNAQLDWAPRTLPLTEPESRPIESAKQEPPWTNTESSHAATLKNVDSRILLERWFHRTGGGRFALEDELKRRGFTPLADELVRPVLSDDPQDRAQVVQTIIDHPGINAPPWLTLLADDRDATVRLAAVNVMATSRDPKLLEKAWQVALHDSDPRIADLATRLRDRRAGTKRR